jgi:hypothetical protein
MGMSSNIFSVGDAPKEDKKPKYIRVAQKFVHDHTDFEGKVCTIYFINPVGKL